MHFSSRRTKTSGFTLIEMLVSIALFTIVMTIGLSVIVSIIDGNKKSQAINSVVDNLNTSIDSMVRDLKTGSEYHCDGTFPIVETGQPSGCSPGTAVSSITFLSTITGVERSVKYDYVAPVGSTPGYIEKTSCQPAPIYTCEAEPTPLTSNDINVTDMRFYVSTPPAPPSSGFGQPSVFIIIGGTAQTNATNISDFHLQTFVSQRILNI